MIYKPVTKPTVGAQLNVAAVSENTDRMVPFSTPLRIKLSFSLWYFVIIVICSDNLYLLLCLVVNLLFHLPSPTGVHPPIIEQLTIHPPG